MAAINLIILQQLCLLLLLASVTTVLTFPLLNINITLCPESDDDCLDALMHPQFSNEQQLRQHANSSAAQLQRMEQEKTAAYWLNQGVNFVKQRQAIAERPLRNVAKNLILMIGDGLSLSTIFATRVHLGGEEVNLSFEEFPDTGLARTYALDRLVPDSAATATALLSGAKTRFGTLGVNGHVKRGDCTATNDDSNVESIALRALRSGKSVGLVTTSSVTDATVAALYAHSADRNWENDVAVKNACGKRSGIEDIASQLVHGVVGSQLSVVLGGGRAHFLDRSSNLAIGKRKDERNLIDEFRAAGKENHYVETRADLLQVQHSANSRLLGLFAAEQLDYNLEAAETQPTLEEMTEIAIASLSKNPNGYLLLVEGALIDTAHHASQAQLALDESAEFNKAVALARTKTNVQDTLVVVTADHSHTITVSGYAQRSNDIADITHTLAADETPYLSLSYANGPAAADFFAPKEKRRRDPNEIMTGNYADAYPATVPLHSATHDAEDVPVYASGPWSYLFGGVYEQSTIAHLLAFAGCLGEGLTACSNLVKNS